jgi:ribosomal protein L7/L12
MPTDSEEIASLRIEVERLERVVEALAKRLGVSVNELLSVQAGNPPADVVDALNAGNLIEAIKRWRAHTGASLADAKFAVEELERGLR